MQVAAIASRIAALQPPLPPYNRLPCYPSNRRACRLFSVQIELVQRRLPCFKPQAAALRGSRSGGICASTEQNSSMDASHIRESQLVACIGAGLSLSLLFKDGLTFMLEAVGVAVLTAAGLLWERDNVSRLHQLSHLRLRQGALPGMSLGAVSLAWVFASLILKTSTPPSTISGNLHAGVEPALLFRLWFALASGTAALLLLLLLPRPPSGKGEDEHADVGAAPDRRQADTHGRKGAWQEAWWQELVPMAWPGSLATAVDSITHAAASSPLTFGLVVASVLTVVAAAGRYGLRWSQAVGAAAGAAASTTTGVAGAALSAGLVLLGPYVLASVTLLRLLITRLPRTFSAGEALLVAQGVTLYALSGGLVAFSEVDQLAVPAALVGPALATSSGGAVASVALARTAQCLLLSSMLLASVTPALFRAQYSGPPARRWSDPKQVRLLYLLAAATMLVLAPAWIAHVVDAPVLAAGGAVLQRAAAAHPLLWCLAWVMTDASRVALVAYWLALLCVGLPLLGLCHTRGLGSTIILRKGFHLLASAIWVPGILWQPDLIRLASMVALAGFVLVEILRAGNVPPLGGAIHRFMAKFVDSRDAGAMYITHMSLLLALTGPVLLAGGQPVHFLSQFAGVIAIGIGDSAVGKKSPTPNMPRSACRLLYGSQLC
eukprot:jgi/Mesvir1/6603/Mv25142-RA.5